MPFFSSGLSDLKEENDGLKTIGYNKLLSFLRVMSVQLREKFNSFSNSFYFWIAYYTIFCYYVVIPKIIY